MLTDHNRAFILEGIGEYLAATGWSARWLGLRVAGDARMVPNLRRGQAYPPAAMIALLERLQRHWAAQQSKQG